MRVAGRSDRMSDRTTERNLPQRPGRFSLRLASLTHNSRLSRWRQPSHFQSNTLITRLNLTVRLRSARSRLVLPDSPCVSL